MTEQPICSRCKRVVTGYHASDPCYACNLRTVVSRVVVFRLYGCDTGCSGYATEFLDADGHEVASHFEFTGPYDLYDLKDKPEEYEREKHRWIEDRANGDAVIVSRGTGVDLTKVPINFDACDVNENYG